MKTSYASIIIVAIVLLWNFVALCAHIVELPYRPMHAALWATFSWLLVIYAWSALIRARQNLWYWRARAAGPPLMWAYLGTGEPIELMVEPMGIDPMNSPAWLVAGLTRPLPNDTKVLIDGLTRHAAVYVPVAGAMVRLEAGRGHGTGTVTVMKNR